jgi:nitrite reductase/ring-hydroxylating ferredoxin subunit
MMPKRCSRRGFCAGSAAGLIALGVGCTRANDGDGLPGWGPGGVGGGSDGNPDLGGTNPDLAGSSHADTPIDFATTPPDFSTAPYDFSTTPYDFSTAPLDFSTAPDLAPGSACGTGVVNCGAASAIAVGAAKHFSNNAGYDFFLCRDAAGLFAVDAACTHAGCDVQLQSGHWYCPCHGATFQFDGSAPTGPAVTALPCWAVCIDGAGQVWVDPSTQVSSTTRV